MSTVPPPPPGFSLDPPKRSKRAAAKRNSAPVAPTGSGPAVDGDTLDVGRSRYRLFGVDAPELDQPGYTRDGVTVPVGRQAQAELNSFLRSGVPLAGPIEGASYGRDVAPFTVRGVDIGRQLVRRGHAVAEPAFVSEDPEYRFQLLQDERLARLNRLGPVNDTFVQRPSDYRADPDYVPTRETIAQWFDTPTPAAGMSPQAEKQYLDLLLGNGTVDQIVGFVESQGGFKVNPTDVQAFIRAREQAREQGQGLSADQVLYERGPEVLTDSGTGASGAAIRGFGQGFVAGGLDELGAVADTFIPTIPGLGVNTGRENVWNSDRRVADIWANNQRQNASILGYDAFAHPYAFHGGEVGGALTSGFAIPYGQGARTVPELARVGGVYGGLGGFLGTDGSVTDRVKGAAIGAPVGAIAGPAVGKAVEFAAPYAGKAVNAVVGRGGQDATRGAAESIGEIAEEALQEAPQGSRAVDRLDIPPGTPNAVTAAPEPVATANPGPVPGRERSWIDIASVPPPPRGFTLDHPPANDLGDTANNLQEMVALARRARPEAIGMDAEPMPAISGDPEFLDAQKGVQAGSRPQPVDRPLSEAQMQAVTSGIQPRDVVPIPSNVVDTVEEAARANSEGRIVPATAPNERDALTSRKVRNFAGVEVPKVGPIDLVGFLRLRGGLADQGGELRAMGITTNAARKGLDFVGSESRFGPMLREGGMKLDDAADAAWREGYFPELSERPTTSQFLDALRESYEGTGRRFLPDDLAEIDTYYGRQAERYDLEQQQLEAGGPVYVDRSVPADENAPFAPPEAYDEWPGADRVKRAGNIDLDKLETPQDIRRALTQINARIGFDAATRGRVTQQETERLASELGMTAGDLLTRRKGQALNAEEALAARQILAASANNLVNIARRIQKLEHPGDELEAEWTRALTRHVAIQEQVSGATAEAGRTLAQFKMLAKSRNVSGEVMASIRDLGGGTKRIKEAADLVLDAVEDSPGRFNTVARKAAKPRFADKLAELYINNLLSGPQTHVVNAVSNTMTALSQMPEHALAAAIGGARRAVARKEVDRVFGGEVGARLFSLTQGAKEGLQFFARALKTGETSDTFSKIAGHDMRAISGVKGEVIRIPGRLLNSADEFFKGVSRRAEINARAYRQARKEGLQGDALTRRVAELSANPPEDIEFEALDFARYMTFQRPLSGMGQNVQRLVRDNPLIRPIITFVRTPVNLLKFSAERSPAAPILKEWRNDFMAGGARRDLAVARATLGTGIMALAYQWALEGRITGGQPLDPAKNRFMRADGWQPYSVRVGDTWVSYSRLDPFAMQFGVVADLATKSEGMTDKQLENYSMLLVASVMGQLADKTWLSGVSDFTNMMADPQRYGPSYLRRLGGAFATPNALPQTARSIDPVQRERDSFGEELQSRIPGLSDGLLPNRDVWGRPITDENRIGPDLLNPFRQSSIKNDPANAAMLEIGARFGPPSKQYTVAGERKEWTLEQYDRLQELAGQAAHSGITELVSSPQWKDMDKTTRLKASRKVFEKARKAAKEAVLGGGANENAPPPPTGFSASADGSVPPPPPGFSVEGDAAGVNVYRDLQESIPGVRFTSGFRTPEYQAKMQSRGYRPAQNSAHLDGSTLDMLPPEGRSLGWLRREVGRLHPEAKLLIHDGHLHAEFPGYYGAPPLEGARSAGVRNPYAGMPAPPAGFTVDAR